MTPECVMPKATGLAADPVAPEMPQDPVDVAEQRAAALPPVPREPEWGFWRYVGDVERTYPHVPVTVRYGDVIHHLGEPAADGQWQADKGPATRQPDNYRTDPSSDAREA